MLRARGATRVRPAATLAAAVALSGCTLLLSTSGLSEEDRDAGPTTDAAESSSDSTIGPDSVAPGDASEDGPFDPTCTGTQGPPMVRVSTELCIDATEVTNAQYAAFLSDRGPTADTSALPAACAFKQSHTPASWPRPGKEAHPVNEVDWCDAWAYCKWAGKTLCGAIGGGPVAASAAANPSVDAWYRACSANGARVYPYGDAFDKQRCNGPGAGVGETAPASSFPDCEGGYPGLLQMSGSVQEWQDSCNGDTGASDSCADRGGGFIFYDPDPEVERMKCSYRDTFKRSDRSPNLGFRCCSG